MNKSERMCVVCGTAFVVGFVMACMCLVVVGQEIVQDEVGQVFVLSDVVLTEQEQRCFDKIQELRAKANLEPFVLCAVLTDESRKWSQNMRKRNMFYHGAYQEICAQTKIECGERAFELWFSSPAHRAFFYRQGTKVGIGNDGLFFTMRGEGQLRPTATVNYQTVNYQTAPRQHYTSQRGSVQYRTAQNRAPQYRASQYRSVQYYQSSKPIRRAARG